MGAMNCPKCNTWNPEDKNYCWRCGGEMPKPVAKPPQRKATFAGLPMWMWLMVALVLATLFLGQCVLSGMAPA